MTDPIVDVQERIAFLERQFNDLDEVVRNNARALDVLRGEVRKLREDVDSDHEDGPSGAP